MTASGVFMRHDNTVVTCSGANAAISGNVVTVSFRAECYHVPGGMRGAVRLSGTAGTVTLADQAFYVQAAFDGQTVTDEYIPTLPQLIANVSRLEQANAIGMVLTAISGLMAVHVEDTTLVIDKVAVTDEGAYAAAVSAGYTGTEEEWDAFVAAVTGNAAMITTANENASEALTTANSKAAVTAESVVAEADEWSEELPYTQTIACTIATPTNNLIVGIGGTLTVDQKRAAVNGNIMCTGQGDGTITLTAFGTLPDEDIPINVLGVN